MSDATIFSPGDHPGFPGAIATVSVGEARTERPTPTRKSELRNNDFYASIARANRTLSDPVSVTEENCRAASTKISLIRKRKSVVCLDSGEDDEMDATPEELRHQLEQLRFLAIGAALHCCPSPIYRLIDARGNILQEIGK